MCGLWCGIPQTDNVGWGFVTSRMRDRLRDSRGQAAEINFEVSLGSRWTAWAFIPQANKANRAHTRTAPSLSPAAPKTSVPSRRCELGLGISREGKNTRYLARLVSSRVSSRGAVQDEFVRRGISRRIRSLGCRRRKGESESQRGRERGKAVLVILTKEWRENEWPRGAREGHREVEEEAGKGDQVSQRGAAGGKRGRAARRTERK